MMGLRTIEKVSNGGSILNSSASRRNFRRPEQRPWSVLVAWAGGRQDLQQLAGQPVRVGIRMAQTQLYSLQFRCA